jgi:hypothetical protein
MERLLTDELLQHLLNRLKGGEVLVISRMDGDEIYAAEQLVSLKLATKICHKSNSYYLYGVSGDEQNNCGVS